MDPGDIGSWSLLKNKQTKHKNTISRTGGMAGKNSLSGLGFLKDQSDYFRGNRPDKKKKKKKKRFQQRSSQD